MELIPQVIDSRADKKSNQYKNRLVKQIPLSDKQNATVVEQIPQAIDSRADYRAANLPVLPLSEQAAPRPQARTRRCDVGYSQMMRGAH